MTGRQVDEAVDPPIATDEDDLVDARAHRPEQPLLTEGVAPPAELDLGCDGTGDVETAWARIESIAVHAPGGQALSTDGALLHDHGLPLLTYLQVLEPGALDQLAPRALTG